MTLNFEQRPKSGATSTTTTVDENRITELERTLGRVNVDGTPLLGPDTDPINLTVDRVAELERVLGRISIDGTPLLGWGTRSINLTEVPQPNPIIPVNPPPAGVTTHLTNANTAADFVAAVNDMTIDVIELAAGTYAWKGIRLDKDRTARPLTVKPAAGATVIFDGTGLGTNINEIFLIGFVSTCRYINFDGSAGRFKFQNWSISQTGLVHPYEAHHFGFSHVDVRSITGPGTFSEWGVYVSNARGVRNQYLTFDDWNFSPGASNVGGFQSYQGDPSPAPGPDHVSVSGWVMGSTGAFNVAYLIWGNGTDYVINGGTVTNSFRNRSFHQTPGPQITMTSVTATSTTSTAVTDGGTVVYNSCSFDK